MGDVKNIALFGRHLPNYFIEYSPQSEEAETHAVKLWNAGFSVLTPHLNAPREENLQIPRALQLAFDWRVIRDFADAVFLVPSWENDTWVWPRAILASQSGKPIFSSLEQIRRWRDGKNYVCETAHYGNDVNDFSPMIGAVTEIPEIKIVYVVGKYFVAGDRNAIHQNILAANKLAVDLWQEGVACFTPHNNTSHFEIKAKVGEERYLEFDMQVLTQLADAVVVLPSWVNSSGGKKEVAKALEIGKPVLNANDLPSIRNWRDGKKPVFVLKEA